MNVILCCGVNNFGNALLWLGHHLCHFGSSAYKSECCEQESLRLSSDNNQNQGIRVQRSQCSMLLITLQVIPLTAIKAVGVSQKAMSEIKKGQIIEYEPKCESAEPRSAQSDSMSRTPQKFKGDHMQLKP
eukprot:3574958-Amphidinium_carterae.3